MKNHIQQKAAIIQITSDSFNNSIETALRNPPNAEKSVNRIKHALSSLPEGKLYSSNHGNEVSFYTVINGHQKYMSKRSRDTHALARKTYLIPLQEILELTGSTKPKDLQKRQSLIAGLQNQINMYAKGNLDIARIVLTSNQYKWFTGSFQQKHIDKSTALECACGLLVRSKSERDIVDACESLAVPFHYEERQFIYVKPLVDKLQSELLRRGFLHRDSREQVYSYYNGVIHWNVPPELEWMNAHGSIWNTYYPPNGTLMIFNDFRILFADGCIYIWEHEGMMDDFFYRCNASERTAIMKITNTISPENLLETCERDVDTPQKRSNIIERCILPRLWF